MKSLLTIIVLSASLFIIGCADDQARSQITDTNIRLSQVEQTVGVLGNKVSNQRVLDLLNKIDDMQNQINQINGNISTLQHDLQTFKDTQNQLNQSFSQQLGVDINKESNLSNSSSQLSTDKLDNNLSTNLQIAIKQIKQHKFEDAINNLKDILATERVDKNTNSVALYYISIAYAASGKYKDAIYNGRKSIEQNPNSSNVPDVLFTIYLSQRQLGMKKSAFNTANILKTKYPNSSATKKISNLK
jgi:TolA-binding protein